MREQTGKKPESSSGKEKGRPKVDTTRQQPSEEKSMSQNENRSGHGRPHNGSDGTGKGRGSNH